MVNLNLIIKKHFSLLLVLVFAVSFFARVWRISDYPVSLSMDEVAIGFNAYSISQTGHDEWGDFLPLAFKSAFDYKPPINIYLTVPFIYLLGLTELAVRLPVVLIGSFTSVIIVLLLIKLGISRSASFFTGLWLALNPWHIHFSRGSFEAVSALFFVISATYLFIKWTDKFRLVYLLGSVSLFSLSVWTYHAERLFTPILFIFLIFLYRKKILGLKRLELKRQIKYAFILLVVFMLPFLKLALFTPAVRERAASTSILRDAQLSQQLYQGNYESFGELVFDNDYYLIYRHWLGKYLRYFNFRFWFWKGLALTPPQYPGIGLLYLVNLPIFLLGVYWLINSKKKVLKNLTFFWQLVGPFPDSLPMNELHTLRSLVWLPFFGFVIAAGFEKIFSFNKAKILMGVYFLLLALNVYYFSEIYFQQFPKFFSEYWQYPYKDVAEYACENKDKFDRVVISETFGSDGPLNTSIPSYYLLFYCQADRDAFIETGNHAEQFLFHRPNYISDNKLRNALRIGSPWDFDGEEIKEEDIIKRFYFKNGKEAFRAVEKHE
jgi:4-amino-4-deoxy-L-arabinose transferase-like glycosyltransferase